MLSFFRLKCDMCKRKGKRGYKYQKNDGKIVNVCAQCAEYAERRAWIKKGKGGKR